MLSPILKSVDLPVPEIIAIGVLGGVANLNLGKGDVWQMVSSERALVTSYRLSIVTFPLSLRVSEILPLFPTPPLVSAKFPHVPLGIGGWLWGYEERSCWANYPCN